VLDRDIPMFADGKKIRLINHEGKLSLLKNRCGPDIGVPMKATVDDAQ